MRDGEAGPVVRDATAADHPAIVALNRRYVELTSPMDARRLAHLDAQSACHRVVEGGGDVAAFLLAFREGADYDSPNYLWFAQRYPRFLYVDRVVVAVPHQGHGFGRQLYDDLFAFAHASGVQYITCEFDIEPPNEASRRFHARYGFDEVGTQALPKGKRVSLQLARL